MVLQSILKRALSSYQDVRKGEIKSESDVISSMSNFKKASIIKGEMNQHKL